MIDEIFSWLLTMLTCKFVFAAIGSEFTISSMLVASIVWLLIRLCYAIKDFKENHSNETHQEEEKDNCQNEEKK